MRLVPAGVAMDLARTVPSEARISPRRVDVALHLDPRVVGRGLQRLRLDQLDVDKLRDHQAQAGDHDHAEPADAAAHQLVGRFVDDPVTPSMVGGTTLAAASCPTDLQHGPTPRCNLSHTPVWAGRNRFTMSLPPGCTLRPSRLEHALDVQDRPPCCRFFVHGPFLFSSLAAACLQARTSRHLGAAALGVAAALPLLALVPAATVVQAAPTCQAAAGFTACQTWVGTRSATPAARSRLSSPNVANLDGQPSVVFGDPAGEVWALPPQRRAER